MDLEVHEEKIGGNRKACQPEQHPTGWIDKEALRQKEKRVAPREDVDDAYRLYPLRMYYHHAQLFHIWFLNKEERRENLLYAVNLLNDGKFSLGFSYSIESLLQERPEFSFPDPPRGPERWDVRGYAPGNS